jgi:hypothetical protein
LLSINNNRQSTQNLVDNRDTHASVVRLDVSLLDLAIFNDQSVTLAAVITEDGRGVKVKVESLCEGAVGVGEEANLEGFFV